MEREIERLGRLTRGEMSRLREACRMTDEDVEAESREPADSREWTIIQDLDGQREGSWVRRVAGMRPAQIRKLAPTSLTDEQVEGILWSAKGRVDPRTHMYSRPPRGLRVIRVAPSAAAG